MADRCAIYAERSLDVLDVKETSTRKMANLMVGGEISLGIEKAD